MTKLFRDLKVGDPIYWVFSKSIDDGIKVEEYSVLTIEKEVFDIVVEVQGDCKIILDELEASHRRGDESYIVLDVKGVEWAVKKIKEFKAKKYQKDIESITDKMKNMLLEPYLLVKKY